MQTITKNNLIGKLLGVRGAAPITVKARTAVKARKNPFGKITKIRSVNGMVNFHYDAGVLRRLEKEGKSPEDFKRGESWHEPVLQDGKLTPFCQNKTDKSKLYLRLMALQALDEAQYLDESGHEVTLEQIREFLPKEREETNQGLDNPLIFRVYDLDNLLEVSVDGEKFEIKE